MSYEPLKAQGSNPPGYRYGQQAAVSSRYGTVTTVAQQDHEARSVQQQDLPETVSTFSGQQSEMCDDPYGVPVAQLNVRTAHRAIVYCMYLYRCLTAA